MHLAWRTTRVLIIIFTNKIKKEHLLVFFFDGSPNEKLPHKVAKLCPSMLARHSRTNDKLDSAETTTKKTPKKVSFLLVAPTRIELVIPP